MSQSTLEQRLNRLEEEIFAIKRMISKLPGKFSGKQLAQEKSEIMSARQLAEFLKIDINVIYIKCVKGDIPYFKLGKQYRFKKIDILNWIKEQKTESEFSVNTYVNRYLQKNELKG